MSEPKIVLFDLETIPNLEEALKVWPQLSTFPGRTLKATVSTILCAAWKTYGEKKVDCVRAWDFRSWKRSVNDDKKICEALYEALSDADAVVTHNGRRFDWKFLQTRLRYHKLPPLPKIHHIDTKATSSKHMYAFNNRLGYLGEQFAGTRKLDHEGWELWVKCWHKDPKAMKTMEKYNIQDVIALEKLFIELKPLIDEIPNYNLFKEHDKPACPKCGSTRLLSNGYRHTQTRSYKRYQCQDCRCWMRVDAKDRNPRGI